MTLNEAFAHALKNDSISHLEMSWAMNITLERLDELLNGAQYNHNEELAMFRFVFKVRQRRPVLNVGPIVGPPVPAPENSNGI